MNKAKIVLLNPPTADTSNEVILSLAYLASALRKNGHEVMVLDATAPFKKVSAEQVLSIIGEYKPNFIGVTLTINFIAQTYEFLKLLKKLNLPIIAGGSHVNPLPEEALQNGVDIVVLGEGENTVVELAEHFSGNPGKALVDIQGLCYKTEDGKIFRTPARTLIKNIDEIPFPSFDDFPIKRYSGSDDPNSNPIFWAMFSSRGCPFNCTFCCGHNVFGRTYRLRSAENLIEEIKLLKQKFNISKIAFQDDEILLSKERINTFCDLLHKEKIKIKMSFRARIDSVETELLIKMKANGFLRMSFGIESWNDDTLTKIKKRYTVETLKKGLAVLDKSAFPYVNFNTIIGFPWESQEHFSRNLESLSQIPASLKYFSIVVTPIPYPNTELYEAYHKQYGFTNWWLDPSMHWKGLPADKPRPIFTILARMMTPLYVPDLFWNYSKEYKSSIDRFCWSVFKLYLPRHLSALEVFFVYHLSRLSHRLWKISPALELLLQKLVPGSLITRIARKYSFTTME